MKSAFAGLFAAAALLVACQSGPQPPVSTPPTSKPGPATSAGTPTPTPSPVRGTGERLDYVLRGGLPLAGLEAVVFEREADFDGFVADHLAVGGYPPRADFAKVRVLAIARFACRNEVLALARVPGQPIRWAVEHPKDCFQGESAPTGSQGFTLFALPRDPEPVAGAATYADYLAKREAAAPAVPPAIELGDTWARAEEPTCGGPTFNFKLVRTGNAFKLEGKHGLEQFEFSGGFAGGKLLMAGIRRGDVGINSPDLWELEPDLAAGTLLKVQDGKVVETYTRITCP